MRIWTAIAIATILLLSGCKKAITQAQEDFLQQYFETNLLNKDFIVKLATDNGTDLTAQYSGYNFKLLKNTLADGPMTATKGSTVYNGTWSANEDYSKLTINFPSAPPEFSFIVRAWRFTKKAVPVMELAPWGTSEPKVLHMERL